MHMLLLRMHAKMHMMRLSPRLYLCELRAMCEVEHNGSDRRLCRLQVISRCSKELAGRRLPRRIVVNVVGRITLS